MDTAQTPFETLGPVDVREATCDEPSCPGLADAELPSGSQEERDFLHRLLNECVQEGPREVEVSFASVCDAVIAVGDPDRASGLSRLGADRARIAAWVVEHADETSFDKNDWHALYQRFNSDDYRSGLAVAQAGLKFFRYDTTLLGDALQACSALACWEVGDRILTDALDVDMRFIEDWYLPVWVSKYYRSKAQSATSQNRLKLLESALAYVRDAKLHMPYEDRVLNQEAEILIEMNDIAGARKVLDEAIFEEHVNGEGLSCHIMAPQCCLTYLDSLLSETDEYDRIIQVAQVGIRCSATTDRKVRTGYFLFRMALAKDCKIHAAAEKDPKAYGNPDLVRDALRSYALAYSMKIDPLYKEIIAERFAILEVMSGISDVALDQFCTSGHGA